MWMQRNGFLSDLRNRATVKQERGQGLGRNVQPCLGWLSGRSELPCTAASGAGHFSSTLTEIRPFVDPPRRRVALAGRVSFPRPQAIEILRQAIRACALDCVTYLGGPTA
jgi:hypothetical protein